MSTKGYPPSAFGRENIILALFVAYGLRTKFNQVRILQHQRYTIDILSTIIDLEKCEALKKISMIMLKVSKSSKDSDPAINNT